MALHGDIRVNHRKIGEWWAVCQPGKDGIHPYRWGATLNGVTVRGVLTHTRADGALVLASKVTAAAAIALAGPETPPGPHSNPDPDTGKAPATQAPQIATEGLPTRLPGWSREPRPEFQALIDAFQPEYDALLRQKGHR